MATKTVISTKRTDGKKPEVKATKPSDLVFDLTPGKGGLRKATPEEKKAAKKPGKPIVVTPKPAIQKPAAKIASKPIKAAPAKKEVAPKKAAAIPGQMAQPGKNGRYTHCKGCGKPLTREDSMVSGFGPECEGKDWTRLATVKAQKTVEDLPKGYVGLATLLAQAKVKGIPASRVMKAIGGNRGAGEPLNENFRFVYWRGERFCPPGSMGALTELAKLPKRTAKAKSVIAPKGKSAAKPATGKTSKKVEPDMGVGPVRGTKKGTPPKLLGKQPVIVKPSPGKKVQPKVEVKKPTTLKRKVTVSEGGVPVLDMIEDTTK